MTRPRRVPRAGWGWALSIARRRRAAAVTTHQCWCACQPAPGTSHHRLDAPCGPRPGCGRW